MTKKELLEILINFDDDTEIVIWDNEHNSLSEVIEAVPHGPFLLLNSGDIELNRLASIAMNIVMDTPVPEYIENAEKYTELIASIAMFDAYRMDIYAEQVINSALVFSEEYHCPLSHKLLSIFGE